MRLLFTLARHALAGSGTTASGHHHQQPELTKEEWTMYICIVVALVLLAGLMSGLTLGLMSMDVLDMEVEAQTSPHLRETDIGFSHVRLLSLEKVPTCEMFWVWT